MKLIELQDGIVISYYPNHMVCFSNNVIEKIKKFIQMSSSSNEAGGFLIGYKRGNHFDITDITTPYKGDVQNRFFFERKDKKHIKKLEYIKKLSLGKKCFLGEWHTHPEKNPKPSSVDLLEWKKTASFNKEILLFLIVGQECIYIKTSDSI